MKEFKLKLKDIYQREAFYPGTLGLFINPFYFARKGLASNIMALADQINGTTLDIGCGIKPYMSLFTSSAYYGLEIESPENRKNKKADFFYDGKTFPFEDNTYDSVVANQVFEHVFNPDEFLMELNRVLKPGGKVLITVPFIWDEHEQPFDFARYSSFGLKSILEKHGFEIIDHRKSMSDIRVIFQLLTGYIYKKTLSTSTFLNLFITFILISPLNILGELFALVTPKNSDLYLDNICLARKI